MRVYVSLFVSLSLVGLQPPVSADVDFNGDARINHSDLNIFAVMYLDGSADLNADARSDFIDVLLFSDEWFTALPKGMDKFLVPSHPKGNPLAGVLGLDLEPGSPHFELATGTAFVDPDSDIDTSRTVSVGQEFSALVRFNGTADLLGYSFDLSFDPPSKLEVIDIRESRMDIDCSGLQSASEKNAIQAFYNDHPFPDQPLLDDFQYSFNDGTGNTTISPGVWMDRNANATLDASELADYLQEFQDNENLVDIPFWTEVAARRAGFNESIEFFSTITDINTNAGFSDAVGILLRRPETAAAGFGFDGNAILLEIVFRALAVGTANIALSNALAVAEDFQDIGTDVMPITIAGSSMVMIQAGPSNTPTPTRTPSYTETSTPTPTPTETPTFTPDPAAMVWVDFAFSGAELGTQSQPYNTVVEGASYVSSGGTVNFMVGSTSETLRITKAMRLEAPLGGPVRIGLSGVKNIPTAGPVEQEKVPSLRYFGAKELLELLRNSKTSGGDGKPLFDRARYWMRKVGG